MIGRRRKSLISKQEFSKGLDSLWIVLGRSSRVQVRVKALGALEEGGAVRMRQHNRSVVTGRTYTDKHGTRAFPVTPHFPDSEIDGYCHFGNEQ